MELILKRPLDFEQVQQLEFAITVREDYTNTEIITGALYPIFSDTKFYNSIPPIFVKNRYLILINMYSGVKLEVNNMNDNYPKFISKNGEEISRLDVYFNAKGEFLNPSASACQIWHIFEFEDV